MNRRKEYVVRQLYEDYRLGKVTVNPWTGVITRHDMAERVIEYLDKQQEKADEDRESEEVGSDPDRAD